MCPLKENLGVDARTFTRFRELSITGDPRFPASISVSEAGVMVVGKCYNSNNRLGARKGHP